MKRLVAVFIAMLFFIDAHSQLLKRIGDRVKQKVEQKIDQKVDKTVDDATSGKPKTDKKTNDDPQQNSDNNNQPQENNSTNNNNNDEANANEAAPKTASIKAYSKFDFVPGEKIVVQEDFSQDAVGDYPDKWNTNSTGEIVTLNNQPGKWLRIQKTGVHYPEFIKELPDNFTFEFDVICNTDFNYYSYPLNISLAHLASPNDFADWAYFRRNTLNGFVFSIHPIAANSQQGDYAYESYLESKSLLRNDANTSQFFAPKKNLCHVAVWRQKQRIRIYLNEEKIFDLPRAMAAPTYNSVVFATGSLNGNGNAEDWYAITNLKLAVGAPDTRNKLITEGKWITHGILFDVNSDKIKAESYGSLKEIATVLKENADVKVTIVGHTDSDGDDKSNLDLSKRRAAAVKNILMSEFGIDESRMTTDGKGESQPVDKNDNAVGKANNRRVEFIKK